VIDAANENDQRLALLLFIHSLEVSIPRSRLLSLAQKKDWGQIRDRFLCLLSNTEQLFRFVQNNLFR
jgi:hypothetical protein